MAEESLLEASMASVVESAVEGSGAEEEAGRYGEVGGRCGEVATSAEASMVAEEEEARVRRLSHPRTTSPHLPAISHDLPTSRSLPPAR